MVGQSSGYTQRVTRLTMALLEDRCGPGRS
jgi:hypothetical protein